MATGGPEPGPSESSRSCDLSLHGFSEQPWSVFAAALGRDHPISDDKSECLNKSYVHRFDCDYMGLFGFFPNREDFLTVVCDECNTLLIPHRVKQHLLIYHKKDSTATKPIQNDLFIKHKEHEHNASPKVQKFNPDIHCGVVSEEDSKPCMHSLTCKSHSSFMRRSVAGRSKPFSKLLTELSQHHHVSTKETKANAVSNSANNGGKHSDVVSKSNHNSLLKSSIKQHEPQPENISNKNHVSVAKSISSNHSVSNANTSGQKNLTSQSARNIQESVKTIIITGNGKSSDTQYRGNHSTASSKSTLSSKLSGSVSDSHSRNGSALSSATTTVGSSNGALNISSSHKVTSQSSKSQESTKSMTTVKLAKSNFSLPLTFPLSCITDLSLLKPNASLLKSAVASVATVATPVAAPVSASIPKKQPQVVSTAPVTVTNTAKTSVTSSTCNAMTNTAINTMHLRNNNHVYLNVMSVDYEQNIPKPSAVCTFNSRKLKNQLIFTPKVSSYKEAFDPVISYFNNIPNQPHSRPPLVSNYNLTNSMNGPHSVNGYNHNPLMMQMPSTPVSSLKPMIGGKPTTYRPLLPKCPPTRAHTPYSFQYQNGYTNGVSSPPPSLAATTSLKRLNPYNVMNNTDEAKQSRTNLSSAFIVDDDDELPNGKTDLTTLMELEFDEP